MTHVIEMAINGRDPRIEGRIFARLYDSGNRGTTTNLGDATKLTFAEAWLVLHEIERTPTPEYRYWITKL